MINVVPGLGKWPGAVRHSGLQRMSFTGSPEVGRMVAKLAAATWCPSIGTRRQGAAVVFDDVDVAATADKPVGAITFTPVRSVATRPDGSSTARSTIRWSAACVERLKLASATSWTALQMGPVVNENSVASARLFASRSTGRWRRRGGRVAGCGGYYVKPALLAGWR